MIHSQVNQNIGRMTKRVIAVFRRAVASLYEVVSVHLSVGPSVRRSARRSGCLVLFFKVERTHTKRIFCRVSGLVHKSKREGGVV